MYHEHLKKICHYQYIYSEIFDSMLNTFKSLGNFFKFKKTEKVFKLLNTFK